MGMASDHLIFNTVYHILKGKISFLFCDLSMHHDLKKQINYLKNLGAKDEANAAVIRSRVKSWGSLTMAEARALIEELK